ncbi:TonB-dependent receptor [Alloalcanivorax dieselolei B5]|uniref:TonB-dependent receptor n=1 Tax=Alcanivorax dieselolei (strain DSM 16502 / CGMCC 1.3690 / MCCC 1A00001 / B-5) TaxID=930169 RepID=K0CET1_ALCDB|nr:TonB-dependent receptor [Alloalcanivorax dieselolei]AFT70790.1 TonB-dependent receptor [Alloalcanivorax dieselolei B5]GGJ97775.1 TonB-dependent receptor [Alloalcanivorax dieselolei]
MLEKGLPKTVGSFGKAGKAATFSMLFLFSPLAAAQDDNNHELDAITVTARQSEERAKDVPFAISVVDGGTLTDQRLDNVEDALRSVPGVNINSSAGANDSNVYIRGVGSLYQMNMDDNSVALIMDGVTLSPRSISLGTLDVERVEVLKGPQGTLFGGNAEAGAINVVSRRPTRHREGYLRLEGGQDEQWLQEGVISGPLSDRFSGRFALRHAAADNWVNNKQTGDPLTDQEDLAFRGSLLWDNHDATTALFIAERQKVEGRTSVLVLRPYGDDPANDLTPGLFDDNEKTMERYSMEINHDLANSRITSVTAMTRMDLTDPVVYDRDIMEAMYGTPMVAWLNKEADEHTYSQDLRIGSLPSSPVFWTSGLSVARSERGYDTTYDSRDPSSAKFRDFTTEQYGLYGEITWPLLDDLKLTAGARHSWDRKEYDAVYRSSAGAVRDQRDLDDDFTTGRLALTYVLTPSTNLYTQIGRGYNPGGFNDYASQRADSEPYDAATAHSWELGFKTETDRLMLNGSVFLTRVKDAHLIDYDVLTWASRAVNADTRSRGAELEGRYRLGGGLSLAGSVSYIDAEITDDVIGISGGDVHSGNQVPDVSEWSGYAAIHYDRPLPDNFIGLYAPALNARISYQYVGERPADPQNHFDLDDYGMLDARLGIASGAVELYLWGENLLDETYDLYGYYESSTVTYGAPGRGRTVGAGLSYYF